MEPEDDKELWDVLGRLPEPTLTPFFARNVLREIRLRPARFDRVRKWFSVRKLVGASAVAAVAVALALVTHYPGPRSASSSDLDVVAKVDPQDYDVVADLDELIAWDENSVWEEKPNLEISHRLVGLRFVLHSRTSAAATASRPRWPPATDGSASWPAPNGSTSRSTVNSAPCATVGTTSWAAIREERKRTLASNAA